MSGNVNKFIILCRDGGGGGGGGDLKDYLWKVDFGGEFSSTKIKYLLKATVEYS